MENGERFSWGFRIPQRAPAPETARRPLEVIRAPPRRPQWEFPLNYIAPVLPILLLVIFLSFAAGGRRLQRVGITTAALLFLWTWQPFMWTFAATLERPYRSAALQPGRDARGAGAIVVLSGDVTTPEPHRPVVHLGVATETRLQYALWLYHAGYRLPILVTGGVTKGQRRIGELMRGRLLEAGIPHEHIWVEDAARNTNENARFSASILKSQGVNKILLVTEAYHMRRGEACFRKQGLEVVPAPCAFRSLETDWTWQKMIPDARTAQQNDELLHEWVGLAVYRLRGWL